MCCILCLLGEAHDTMWCNAWPSSLPLEDMQHEASTNLPSQVEDWANILSLLSVFAMVRI